MAAQSRGAAGGNRPQDAAVLAAQVRVEPVAMALDDIRQLQRGALEWRCHVEVESVGVESVASAGGVVVVDSPGGA
jgi:hypothetical protein